MNNESMGYNEYARHRGCTPGAVRRAEKDGRITSAVKRDEKGRFLGIDYRLADQLWLQKMDPAVTGRNELRRSAEKDPHGYLKARAKREDFQARQAELDYLRAIGELISASDQRQVSAHRYRAMRDALLNIPDRVASILAAERDPARVHLELTNEIKRVLHELSDEARAEAARGAMGGNVEPKGEDA
jgi:hypothetical protein